MTTRPVPADLILGLPLGPDLSAWSRGETAIREAVWNILLTRPGERIMRPEFGGGLTRFVHEPNTETTRALMADAAERAVARWESRVEGVEARATADPQDPTLVHLAVRWRSRLDGAEDGLSLSLSLAGGV